jgi:hypothetical protein
MNFSFEKYGLVINEEDKGGRKKDTGPKPKPSPPPKTDTKQRPVPGGYPDKPDGPTHTPIPKPSVPK